MRAGEKWDAEKWWNLGSDKERSFAIILLANSLNCWLCSSSGVLQAVTVVAEVVLAS